MPPDEVADPSTPTGEAGRVGVGDAGEPATPGQRVPRSPRRLRAFLVGVVIAAALAVFLFVGLGTSRSGPSGQGGVVGVGSTAPGFSLPPLTGTQKVVLDALGRDRHRPVVLNFFASWCVPCQEETPLLASTARAEQIKGSTVQFVGVDVADPRTDAVAFVQRAGIVYPVGVDSDLSVTSGLYGLNGQPDTFFIDAAGTVVGRHQGALTAVVLDGWLHRLAGSAG